MKELRYFSISILFIIALYYLRAIITPFLFALIISYLTNPLVLKLEAREISRFRAVLFVFNLITLILLIFVFIFLPVISGQFERLFAQMPNYIAWIKLNIFPKIAVFFGDDEQLTINIFTNFMQENSSELRNLLGNLLKNLLGSANYIIIILSYTFLIPIITFYLLKDWGTMCERLYNLIPRNKLETITNLLNKCDDVLSGFLRGQLLVMLSLSIIYSIGLSLLGLDMAFTIGFISGLVSFVPYLGFIIGFTSAAILAVLQFQSIIYVLAVGVVFAVAQSIEGVYLTPKFVGDRTGLHPVAVLFAVLTGGHVFGFTGILLAIPVAAVINVFLGYFKEKYLKSAFYLGD